jgi:hypothetical protein
MEYAYVLTALAGAVFGVIVAYLNMLITRSKLKADSVMGIMGGNMLRLLLDAAALAAAYFISKALDAPVIAALLATAVGLSVGGMVFLRAMLKKIQPRDDTADGGE